MTDQGLRGGDNADDRVVAGFGDEWTRFDQSALPEEDRVGMFADYFSEFPWDALPPEARGADIGCGSGRWAALVAPRVGSLLCFDASDAAARVAVRTLSANPNATVVLGRVGELPLAPGSLDFAYSLGVLHHVPDTLEGLRECVRALKPGAPFLVYLYYAFDDRPAWFVGLWRMSDLLRRVVSSLPNAPRHAVSQVVAALVYWPLARVALLAERLGRDVSAYPLSFYRRRSFYMMRTDALDRLGTRLEQRFTRPQIEQMMLEAGLTDVRFRDGTPYWTAVGRKA